MMHFCFHAVTTCLGTIVHLLTCLHDPTLCLLHRAWGGVTKDKEKMKKKSQTQSLKN